MPPLARRDGGRTAARRASAAHSMPASPSGQPSCQPTAAATPQPQQAYWWRRGGMQPAHSAQPSPFTMNSQKKKNSTRAPPRRRTAGRPGQTHTQPTTAETAAPGRPPHSTPPTPTNPPFRTHCRHFPTTRSHHHRPPSTTPIPPNTPKPALTARDCTARHASRLGCLCAS